MNSASSRSTQASSRGPLSTSPSSLDPDAPVSSAGTSQASAPAATTKYSGTSRLEVLPPVEIGTRNGNASTASSGNACGLRRITTATAASTATAITAPTTAYSG